MRTDSQDDLRIHYQRELSYLRKAGAEFAQKYPKIAGRLELGAEQCADPHIERLLESFAFLTARIQYRLDSEFPEITTALLGLLYPQLLNPIPSMAVAQFEVDPERGKLTAGYLVEKHTPLFAPTHQGPVVRFRTCYPVLLWPIEVVEAGIESADRYDFLDPTVATVLRIRLACQGGDFNELELNRLRFYINGSTALVSTIYELLFCHTLRITLLPLDSSEPVYLPQDALSPVGFALDEDVLPYPEHAHNGYRLLQEYFTFPEKYLFFDIDHLDQQIPGHTCDLLIQLAQSPAEPLAIDRGTFRLGCTPIINLFTHTTEPIRLDHRRTEYRLVPNMRWEGTTEIHSILHVSASTNAEDDTQTLQPFYSFSHESEEQGQAFWHSSRRPTGRKDIPGTDVFLSLLDLDFDPSLPPVQTVYAHTLCTNRDLAEQMPEGTLLQIEEVLPIHHIRCLAKPTPTLGPPLGGETLWRLISHLSLNYLSLTEGKVSIKALREILQLYSYPGWLSSEQQIMGIQGLTCRPVVRHLGPDAWRGFCRGMEITLTFDEALYVGSSAFLFASILNHFFSMYASVNSFTELVIASSRREGIWKRWQPMVGAQMVL